MKLELTQAQRALQARARQFVDARVAPRAAAFDRDQALPPELAAELGAQGFLGGLVPAEHGGQPEDLVAFGLLNEELGRGCSSVRSLLTVHSMVCATLARWGTPAQRQQWLPRLAKGAALGAFALTEPAAGSDAASISTSAVPRGGGYALTGVKKWITVGQIADVFLLFAQLEGRACAFLVPRTAPGLSIRPIRDVLGTRGSMLAELVLEGCEVEAGALVGAPGFGISAIATSALDIGRYSVAWGCVGISQACLEACRTYVNERVQFGKPLHEHQLVRELFTDMVTSTHAARLLCLRAGQLKDKGDPDTVAETFMAKYFASRAAMKSATDAVQLHGALGTSAELPVARYFRDAKVMEIIEGSTQIQQVAIAGAYLRGR